MSAIKKSPHTKSSELRILSGKYKGTKLKSPDLATTHPMGSREKLALFNMLSPYLEGATVLDYFAGSGALGLEALSRGAASVTFVENNPKALEVIKENLRRTSGIAPVIERAGNPRRAIRVMRAGPPGAELGVGAPSDDSWGSTQQDPNTPATSQLARGQDQMLNLQYDIIISDPPYDDYQVPDYEKLLKKGGILALSHPKDFNLKAITGLTLLKTNHYAACHISLFTK